MCGATTGRVEFCGRVIKQCLDQIGQRPRFLAHRRFWRGAFHERFVVIKLRPGPCVDAEVMRPNRIFVSFELGEHLNEALSSRAVIEQAKGILMAGTQGLTADAAFDMLRRASQRENVKLREIAMRIVEGRTLPQSGEGNSG